MKNTNKYSWLISESKKIYKEIRSNKELEKNNILKTRLSINILNLISKLQNLSKKDSSDIKQANIEFIIH